MKRLKIVGIILLTVISLLTGCGRTEVPDLMEKDEKTAVKMVEDAGLIPVVEYEFRDDEPVGKVFKTRPKIESLAKKNTEVVIYISKGPEKVIAKNAYSKWTTLGKSAEKWEIRLPYLDFGDMRIDCHNVILSTPMRWEKGKDGFGYGEVSLDDTFEKTVPVKVEFEKESWEAFEPQKLIISFPIEELGEDRPSQLCFRLFADDNGNRENVRMDVVEIKW